MLRTPSKSLVANRAGSPAAKQSKTSPRALVVPSDRNDTTLSVPGGEVHLTNLRKVFWPELKLTKHDLLQYYSISLRGFFLICKIARW